MKKVILLLLILYVSINQNAYAHCPIHKPYHCVNSHGFKMPNPNGSGSIRIKVGIPILDISGNSYSRRGVANVIYKHGRMLFKKGENGVFHGNYCGLGNKPNSNPTDAIDKACMQHDRCWAKRGTLDCSCDRRLARKAYKISRDSKQPPKVRGIATDVAAFFSITPCKPKLGKVFR